MGVNVPEEFFSEQLPNGLTLLGQRMEQVSSAATALVLAGGSASDEPDRLGAASIATEWCLRGAGDRDTRQLNDALDTLGCQHHESVQSEHVQFSAAQLGRNLADVLTIYADIVRRPRLEDATFGPSRDLVLQDLLAIEDEPAQKCNMMLRERFYPPPLGRCAYGTVESLEAATADGVREHVQRAFLPADAILAVAGNIDWAAFRDLAVERFGGWEGPASPSIQPETPAGGVTHIQKDSAQVHVALAHASLPASDGRYYAARVAETVLSGGMSCRLFTEVREKRGLVYHVSTRYHSLKDHAGFFTYAGTTPGKAQETLDVIVGELRRLAEGIEPAELARAKTQLKSGMVMQGESTSARSGALAADWYHLQRLRGLDEIAAEIDRITADDVLAYLDAFPARDFTLLYIGPETLDVGVLTEGGK